MMKSSKRTRTVDGHKISMIAAGIYTCTSDDGSIWTIERQPDQTWWSYHCDYPHAGNGDNAAPVRVDSSLKYSVEHIKWTPGRGGRS